MDEIGRVGAMLGPPWSKAWAAEIRLIAAKLAEGAERGPRGLLWPREAMRLKLAATVALRGRGGGKSLDSKALRDGNGKWPSAKSRDFARFIRRIGGYSADGNPAVSPLDYDSAHFERAASLISGEAAPDSAAERKALASWQGKYGESP
jgi:hypothetical protein